MNGGRDTSASRGIRETQSKTTMRYHFTPVRLATIKEADNTSVSTAVGSWDALLLVGVYIGGASLEIRVARPCKPLLCPSLCLERHSLEKLQRVNKQKGGSSWDWGGSEDAQWVRVLLLFQRTQVSAPIIGWLSTTYDSSSRASNFWPLALYTHTHLRKHTRMHTMKINI